MKKIAHIIIGWGKRLGFIPISKAEDKLSKLRMDVCQRCACSSESRILKLLNGMANYEKVLKCDKCNCPLHEKTIVVDESCPLHKW